jgi:RNA polymerase sigma-70 factor (ECF subfamily)
MEESEQELVARAAGGDEDAFRIVVQRHSRRLFELAFRITRERASAEDIVQETFMKAYRALHRFDGRSELASWLHRIALNTALDGARQRRARPEVKGEAASLLVETSPGGEPDPERVAGSSDLRRALRRAMAGLTPLERVAFVLRHHEGCSTEEIGAQLGLRASASRQAVFRAVRKLRAALAPWIEEHP